MSPPTTDFCPSKSCNTSEYTLLSHSESFWGMGVEISGLVAFTVSASHTSAAHVGQFPLHPSLSCTGWSSLSWQCQLPCLKSTSHWPKIKFHMCFLCRILRGIQNWVGRIFISSRKVSFKHENGFLVDKKIRPTRIWIPCKKLLLLAAWVPSGL